VVAAMRSSFAAKTKPERLLFEGLAALALSISPVLRANSQAVVAGRVLEDSSGRALAGAEILIERMKVMATTDAGGRFSIAGLQQGKYLIQVRRVGYQPVRRTLHIEAVDTVWLNVVLVPAPQPLEPVVVEGTAGAASRLGAFEEHRRLGFGSFIDSTELRRFETRRVTDLMRRFPSVQLIDGRGQECSANRMGSCYAVSTRRFRMGGGPCFYRIYLDGVPTSLNDLTNDFDVGNLDGIEVYSTAAAIPAEYNSASSGCGVIALWSRRP
jgi:hypothetical protein